MIRILQRIDLNCFHQEKCSARCFQRGTKSCRNLIAALTNLYEATTNNVFKHHDDAVQRAISNFRFPEVCRSKSKQTKTHFSLFVSSRRLRSSRTQKIDFPRFRRPIRISNKFFRICTNKFAERFSLFAPNDFRFLFLGRSVGSNSSFASLQIFAAARRRTLRANHRLRLENSARFERRIGVVFRFLFSLRLNRISLCRP